MISAGHCFTDEKYDPRPNPTWDELIVGFGIDDIALLDAPFLNGTVQTRKIKEVYFHKNYSFPEAYFDIVIVQLDYPVKISQQAYPICLPDNVDPDRDSMRGDPATLVGYGPKTDKSTKVNQLQHTIIPQQRCEAIYDPSRPVNFQVSLKIETTLPNMFKGSLICAGNLGNPQEGTCGGDSGAPLIVSEYVDFITGELKFKLVAILHGGIVPCDNSVYAAIYNRIASPEVYGWILDTISGTVSSDLKISLFLICFTYLATSTLKNIH